MTFANRVRVHSWVGYKISDEDTNEEYVYITENASVYHTNRNCTHLRLSIDTVSKEDISSCRNKDGKKYEMCRKCAKDAYEDEIMFLEMQSLISKFSNVILLMPSDNKEESIDINNYSSYTLKTGGYYMYLSRVDNTFLYVKVKDTYQDSVKKMVKELGY